MVVHSGTAAMARYFELTTAYINNGWKFFHSGQPWFATPQQLLAGIAGKSLKGILHQYLTCWHMQHQRTKQSKLRRAHIWICTKSHDSEYYNNMKYWNLNTRKMLRHFNATRAHEVDCRSLRWQCHHRPPWLGQEACQVSCSVFHSCAIMWETLLDLFPG